MKKKFLVKFFKNLLLGSLGFLLLFAIVKTHFFKTEESRAQVVGPTCQIFGPDTVQVGQSATFNANAFASVGNNILFSEWDFGTGPMFGQSTVAPTLSRTQAFTFNFPQTSTVTFKIRDSAQFNNTGSCNKQVIVTTAQTEAPVCRNLTAMVSGLHVDLTADCFSPLGRPITQYVFNFGANTGGVATGREQTSSLNTMGYDHATFNSYTAYAFVRDDQFRTSNRVFTSYVINSVNPPPGPIIPPPPIGCPFSLFAGIRNAATGDTFGPNKTTQAGQPIQVGAFRDQFFQQLDSSLIVHVSGPGIDQDIQSGGTFIPNQQGSYTIRAIFGGCASNPATLNIIGGGVIGDKPICTLSHQVNGMNVTVTNNATHPLGFQINQFFFDFGDGFGPQFSGQNTASHTYSFQGLFKVSSFVVDTRGIQSDRCETPQFFVSPGGINPPPINCPPGFTPVFNGITFTCQPIQTPPPFQNCPIGFTPVQSGNTFICVPIQTPFPTPIIFPTPFPPFFPQPTPIIFPQPPPIIIPAPQPVPIIIPPAQPSISISQSQTATGGSSNSSSHTDPINIRID